jgi:hypothetical protein
MNTTTTFIQFFFVFTNLASVTIFFSAAGKKTSILILLGFLMLLQTSLAYSGILLNKDKFPPPLLLVVVPSFLIILYVFFSRRGKQFINQLNYETLNYMHIVRIPVELVLFLLFAKGLVPESMTFEGRNFDIFSGLTAGFIAYFGYRKKWLSKGVLIGWNLLCLALVLQVVITGILSVPSPFQQLSFEQPNVGVLLFPYVWLPGIIVPLVVFAHIASLRNILYKTMS